MAFHSLPDLCKFVENTFHKLNVTEHMYKRWVAESPGEDINPDMNIVFTYMKYSL